MDVQTLPFALADTAQRAEAALAGWRITRMRADLAGPLAVVGAGGSLSAAHLWARLHERSGSPAWALSPYEFISRPIPAEAQVLILSASGRHHDILGAARHGVRHARGVHAVTCAPRSPLGSLVREGGEHNGVVVAHLEPRPEDPLSPLHAQVPLYVVAARVYGGVGPVAPIFSAARPAPFPEGRPTELISFGAGDAQPAAYELAHKLRELGLCRARHTDLREFAHGEFAVAPPDDTWLAFCATSPQLAYHARYRAALPHTHLRLQSQQRDTAGAFELIAISLITAAHAGQRWGRRDLRPAPPPWASRLYHLPVTP